MHVETGSQHFSGRLLSFHESEQTSENLFNSQPFKQIGLFT